MAEKDRMYLDRVEKSDAIEAQVMKRIDPEWKTGESVYHTKNFVPRTFLLNN